MIMYFSLMKNEKLKLTTILTTIVILAFFSSSQIRKDIEGISPDKKLLESRLQVQKYVDELKPMMSSNDKSYFIIQNSTGFEKYIYNYLMSPFHTSWWCWSLGDKYYNNDVWTCGGDISSYVHEYNYITIFRADAKFIERNKKYILNGDNLKNGNYIINSYSDSLKIKPLK
ncbi:hypothetical protein AAY47_17780 [Xenorhabdus griffiniae]|nr:hypothetical protein AAY47_17780 [Xenorhabdus griffiniae]